MDFTIITPSLNYGHFLGDCLGSVASQQGVTFEHLVFDGGSVDHSAAVAAQFPHIQWEQQADRGMSHAINKGFEKSTGDWVIWLNADDRLKQGALEMMLPYLQRSVADVVYGDWDFINELGIYQRTVKSLEWSKLIHVHHHCYVGSTAAFYRRASVIDSGHRLREDFRFVMDGEFYARLDSLGKRFEYIPKNLADFRMHGANASQRHLGKGRDLNAIVAAETQHVESRAIRRAYGITLFEDPYLNGWMDGFLWIAARAWKVLLRRYGEMVNRPNANEKTADRTSVPR